MPNTQSQFLNRAARWRATLLIISAALPFAFTISAAHAGQYVLEKGKGVEVCEAYKKNLESFKLDYPMACERKINPEFKDFEKPEWEVIEPFGNGRELLRRVMRYHVWRRGQFAEGKDEESRLDHVVQSRKEHPWVDQSLMSRTHIDINNDGSKEDLLAFHFGFCGDTTVVPYPETNLFEIKKGPKQDEVMIATETSIEKLLRTKVSPGGGGLTIADLFRHKNKTYIDKYCLLKNIFTGCDDVDILTVFKIEKNITNEICRYKYHAK